MRRIVRVATSYNWEFLPLLVWVVVLACTTLALGVLLAKRSVRQKSRLLWTVCASLWTLHFLICWYSVVRFLGFKWTTAQHLGNTETADLWYNLIRFFAETVFLSSWLLVMTTLLLTASQGFGRSSAHLPKGTGE